MIIRSLRRMKPTKKMCEHGDNQGHCELCGNAICIDCGIFIMDASELFLCPSCYDKGS
ncbi:hypothetical protein LCGC14_2799550 [marine sediment metagenome]|uniref:Uncharacterized protein n=1 Tax=marine sediment metagenome TaxID=412755 RepID=A0A0F8YN25_9ZZZZ